MDYSGLFQLILDYRTGDAVAHEQLLERTLKMVDKFALSTHGGSGLLCDHALDAVLHVIKQLNTPAFDPHQCRGDPAAAKWIIRVSRNFIASRLRESVSLLVVPMPPDPEAPSGIPEPPSRVEGHYESVREEFVSTIEGLAPIHAFVETYLEGRSSQVDYAALYVWHFRAQMYRALRQLYGGANDWFSCLGVLEEAYAWNAAQASRQFKTPWPPIGALWEHLRPKLEESINLDASTLVEAAQQLSPKLTTDPVQLYQWFCRLDKRLKAMVENSVFPADILNNKLFDPWCRFLGLPVFDASECSGD